jgi:hypothetical protein
MRVRLFALDEEFRPGQDEATVRPWEGALPFDPGEGLNAHGSAACRDDGIVQQAIKITKHVAPEVLVITDLCFCEYTDHGQCVRRVCDGRGRRRHRLDRRTADRARNPHKYETRRHGHDPHVSCTRRGQVVAAARMSPLRNPARRQSGKRFDASAKELLERHPPATLFD